MYTCEENIAGSVVKHRMAYVYMVRCKDDSLYTGIAKDLGHRMNEHYYKKKNGAKYTKSRQIQTLEMVWETGRWRRELNIGSSDWAESGN